MEDQQHPWTRSKVKREQEGKNRLGYQGQKKEKEKKKKKERKRVRV